MDSKKQIARREIKFRGLRTGGKGWAYGFYALWQNEHMIFPESSIGRHRKVIPETVGQFTGLKDKNGVEIYEGDIILLKADSESAELGKAYGVWETRCIFDKNKCKFLLRCTHKPNLFWGFNDLDFNGKPFIKEVMYNIHES